jgi:hypothetical protein
MKFNATAHVFMCLHVKWDTTTRPSKRKEVWEPELWPCKVDENSERVYIGEHAFAVEIPDGFDPVPGQVAALRQKQAEALELYQRTVAQINERLQKLLAITNQAEVPA